MKQKLPEMPEDDYLFPSKKVEPVKQIVSKTQTYKPTNVATEKQTNKQTEVQVIEQVPVQPSIDTNVRLNLYLSIYSLKASKEQVDKGSFKATNVEISDELRLAMDKLIAIYVDGVVASETDKSYKEIVNNALYEYLTKQYKRLQNY